MKHKATTGQVHRGAGNRPASGFTLAELLVVIALVTILVAVLVPVTVQSRNRARSVACVSNLRQLGEAIAAYTQDWEDRLPALSATAFAGSAPSGQWPEGSSATQLRTALAKYARSEGVHRCGNDYGAPEYGYGVPEGSVFSRAGSSYLPWSTARSGAYGIAVNGARVGGLVPLSKHVLLRDYGSDWHGYRTRSGLEVEAQTVANAAYADGHSASVPVFSVAVGGRTYACWAAASDSSDGAVFLAGGAGDVRAELSGRRTRAAGALGQPETRFSISGTVEGGGTVHNVDRVFVFGADVQMDAAFRQITAWADDLAAR